MFLFLIYFLIHDGAKVVEDTFFNSRPPRRFRYLAHSKQVGPDIPGGSRDSRWVLRTLPRGLPLVLYAKSRSSNALPGSLP
jgi:hypothetical protein